MDGLRICLVLSATVLSFAASACPSGWIRNGTTCYHFSHDKEDWPDALGICQLIGGTLLEINSADENNFIASEIATRKDYEPFVALSDVREENVWVWMVSNSQLTGISYTNWADGQPNNNGGVENCVIVRTSGQWADEECYHTKFYVCEQKDTSGVAIIG